MGKAKSRVKAKRELKYLYANKAKVNFTSTEDGPMSYETKLGEIGQYVDKDRPRIKELFHTRYEPDIEVYGYLQKRKFGNPLFILMSPQDKVLRDMHGEPYDIMYITALQMDEELWAYRAKDDGLVTHTSYWEDRNAHLGYLFQVISN